MKLVILDLWLYMTAKSTLYIKPMDIDYYISIQRNFFRSTLYYQANSILTVGKPSFASVPDMHYIQIQWAPNPLQQINFQLTFSPNNMS